MDIDKDVVLPLLQPIITSISLQETSNTVQQLIQKQASEPSLEKLSIKNTPQSDHKSAIEIELELLESRLRTVRLALEILTGACATLPDPEPDLPAGKEDTNDDEDEEGKDSIFSFQLFTQAGISLDIELETEGDADVAMDEEPATPTSSNPSFLTTLVAPLIALIQPTTLSFPPLAAPSIHPPTTSALSAVHINALECLNNIFLSLTTSPNPSVSFDVNSGITVWNGIWSSLGLVGTQTGLGQERRQEMWDIAIGVLWGVGRVWKGSLVGVSSRFHLFRLIDAFIVDP